MKVVKPETVSIAHASLIPPLSPHPPPPKKKKLLDQLLLTLGFCTLSGADLG